MHKKNFCPCYRYVGTAVVSNCKLTSLLDTVIQCQTLCTYGTEWQKAIKQNNSNNHNGIESYNR